MIDIKSGSILLIVFAVFCALMALVWGQLGPSITAEMTAELDNQAYLAEMNQKHNVPNVVNEAFHVIGLHAEASLVRYCYDQKGAIKIYVEPDKQTYHCLVNMGNMVGDRIIIKGMDGKWYEKSAFCPKGGCMKEIIKWLTRKGAKLYTKPVLE